MSPWWRHQMEPFSALLAICAGNSPVSGEFSAQRPMTRSFDVFFDLRKNKRLSKQSWGWWFETLSRPLWRHCNDNDHQWNGPLVRACCLTAPNHYVNQYWLITSRFLYLSPKGNSTGNDNTSNRYDVFENYMSENQSHSLQETMS